VKELWKINYWKTFGEFSACCGNYLYKKLCAVENQSKNVN